MTLRAALFATTTCTMIAASAVLAAYAQEEAPAGQRARGPGAAPDPIRHLLYIATPGDAGRDGQSGIVVLDADHGYVFLKRISYDLPASKMPGPKVSGITASVPLNMIYVTTATNMFAIDLATDKIAWTFNGEPGGVVNKWKLHGRMDTGCCERPWMLPDGKTILVNSSYNNWVYYIDAATGKLQDKVMLPDTPITHNLVVSPDGKIASISSETGAMREGKCEVCEAQGFASESILDVPNHKVLRTITFGNTVRPLTMNHDGRLVYANINGIDGFEIGDTRTGKVIKTVELPGELWKEKWANPNGHFFGHGTPSHGIGMTPDESEIWVTDAVNDSWQVWDNSPDGLNPVYNPSKTVKITPNVASSWISMTNDGKLAFVGDGSIIDVKAHKVIGVMKDEYGRQIHAAEKVLYFSFNDGKLVETSNQFAVGLPEAYKARVAALSK